MPRPPRLDKVIAFAHKLASDLEVGYRELAGIRGELLRVSELLRDVEVLEASVIEKSRNGSVYRVLQVKRPGTGFFEGGVLSVYVTRKPELGDLVVRLVHLRNVYAEWVKATISLLDALERTPSLLEEYKRLVSPTGSPAKQEVRARGS
ncbi:hypothetical protein PABY_02130 [Pyrodictium abyssi]|uniref:Uncharacterized protein n=2 Tax=Pyrodictium abyssi TaxID=54256 RepID=A0ABN6ZS52_9CREN|nr:hypothetical protein PABY_02130 [Pyrodictium abyssi]